MFGFNKWGFRRVILMIPVLLVVSGCNDDDDPVVVIPEPAVGPESATELVDQFVAAYSARNVDKYLALLDPEFLMVLQTETTQEFPSVGATLDYAKEERIHQRMFSGESLTDPDGEFVPAVQTIEFLVFTALDSWTAVGEGDQFPDTVWAPFEVGLVFDRGQAHGALELDGIVKIHARNHVVTVDGKEESYFLMAGMVDLTNLGKGVDGTPWGKVKALYR